MEDSYEESKTKLSKIRWFSAVAIVFLITATAVIVNSHPYEFKVSMDDNTKISVMALSEQMGKLSEDIIDTKTELGICQFELNQTRLP